MISTVLLLLLNAPDAGLLKADAGTKDAGVSLTPPDPEAQLKQLDKRLSELAAKTAESLTTLKQRVAELETKSADLELKLKQAESNAKRAADEYAAFKKDVLDKEQQRKDAEQKAIEQRQRFDAVTRGFVAVDQQLAQGSMGNVNELIRQAEASYSGAALQYVQAAKAALANNDYGGARRYLLLAVMETQFSRQ